MQMAKSLQVAVFLVGHAIRGRRLDLGPKVLEPGISGHGTVLRGRQTAKLQGILRAAKNRFGSTNEIGVFEMQGRGA